MTLAWIVYALAVGTLLSVTAWASERLLRWTGRQGRWAWVAAGLGSLALPAAALLGLGPELGSLLEGLFSAGSGGGSAVELPAATVVAEATGRPVEPGWSWSFLPALSRAARLGVFGAWAGASALLLGLYAFTWRRLRHRLDRWPMCEMEGAPVRLTGSTGPAVVGVLRPVMMVPDWVRDLPADDRTLVLRHEREHLRAGDSRLLALFPLLAALVPWNLPLWWQLRRLRLAVELDCDARVLSRGCEPADYGRLLLSMTRRPEEGAPAEPLPLMTAALLERKSDLERRIRTMTGARPRAPFLQATALAALAALALFVACDTPAPLGSDPGSEVDAAGAVAPDESVEPASDGDGAAGSAATEGKRIEELPPPPMGGSATDRPALVPRDVDPRLTNVDDVQEALDRLYPEEAKRRGLEGRTVLWLYVDTGGRVEKAQVQESSRHTSLDRAAMQVAAEMRFEPARQDGEPLGVWISQPVDFRLAATENRGAVRKTDDPPPAPTSAEDPGGIVTLREVGEADAGGSRFDIRADTMRFSDQEPDTVRADTVRLRGVTSVDASDRSDPPLIIVDGVVQGRDVDLEELNALDIERIEVVKGRAAERLYGDRASHGLIQITTKASVEGGG